jgi:hypothetical protein
VKARWVLAMMLCALSAAAHGQSRAKLDLPAFAALGDKASHSVIVSLDSTLLGMAGRFLNAEDPDEADAKRLVSKLTGIYVRSYHFDTDFVYPRSEIERIRHQLTAPGWNRIVQTRNREQPADVDIYVLVENGKAMGLALISVEPRELTVVNIVGSIELSELHELEGKFGVPKLSAR